ncbi:flippase [Fictibacillus norfolkensis]|uniref:Flippase n=1 Tax=Fictibacillus norfolkensis TaxID=2762233 RepID=A0ABR8SNH7_9BACL|nr:flippase [Fictibacillus norfolkensis]MBD7964909.1 flippase [Fictibacillus norfolkensis]
MNSSFIKNNIFTLSRQIISIFISLISSIFIARYLGPEGQGSYSLIILLPLMLLTFLNFGIGSSSIFYIGKKEENLNTIIKTIIFTGIWLSIISVIIGLIIILLFSDQFFSGISLKLLLASLLVLPFLFTKSFLQSIFQGKQNFQVFNIILLVEQITILILVILLFKLVNVSVVQALIAYFIGQVITLISIVIIIKRDKSINIKKGRFSSSFLRKSLQYGLKVHLSNVLAFVNYRADILMISFFINPMAVGIYTIAVNIAEKLWIISQSASTVLFPKIASLKNNNDGSKITSQVNRNVLAICTFLGCGIFFSVDYIIYFLFGEMYSESSIIIKLLLPGIILFSVARILSNDFAGRGKPEINLYTAIFTVFFNICLNLYLIPLYGIEGAAIATSITYSLNSIMNVFIFINITGQSLKSTLLITLNDIRMYIRIFTNIQKRFRKG